MDDANRADGRKISGAGWRPRRLCRPGACIPGEMLVHVYNAMVVVYLLVFFSRIPKSAVVIAVHVTAAAAYVLFQLGRNRYGNPLLQAATIWIPLMMLSGFHYETGLFNRMIFHDFLDPYLVLTSKVLFSMPLHIAFREKVPYEWVAQVSHAAYASFYLLLAAPITLLYFKERKLFQKHTSPAVYWSSVSRVTEMQFVLLFTMFVCYIVAVIFPVKGPTGYHDVLFPEPCGMVAVMNYLFSNGDLDGGAMPSSHVAGALVVVIYTFKYLRPWFWAAAGLFVPLTLSTVYNSYHYMADVCAGLAAGWLLYRGGRAVFRVVDYFCRSAGAVEGSSQQAI
jgi:hypothetical protein